MYVTVTEYQTHATSVGKILPATEEEQTQQLLQASHFIDANEGRFKGIRTDRDQDYAFPRYGFSFQGYSYTSSEVPEIVERLQMELALDINDDIDIFNREYNQPITKEKVGPVEVGYASPSSTKTITKTTLAERILSQLTSNNFSIPLTRA